MGMDTKNFIHGCLGLEHFDHRGVQKTRSDRSPWKEMFRSIAMPEQRRSLLPLVREAVKRSRPSVAPMLGPLYRFSTLAVLAAAH